MKSHVPYDKLKEIKDTLKRNRAIHALIRKQHEQTKEMIRTLTARIQPK